MSRNELIFNILKEIQNGRDPKPSDYGLDHQEWLNIVALIIDNEYAKNIKTVRGGRGNELRTAWLDKAILTDKGKEFIKDNEL